MQIEHLHSKLQEDGISRDAIASQYSCQATGKTPFDGDAAIEREHYTERRRAREGAHGRVARRPLRLQ